MRASKKGVLTFGLLIVIAIGGCVSPEVETTGADWMGITLKDVRTGETFKISDFKGKPVLLESFAVWCPTCTEQQKRTKELDSRVGDAIIHVSLDTDPNEDAEIVKEHIERNGFDWYYAVSPIEFTNALIDEFGLKAVNAPGVPMILICEDQSTRFLRGGIKSPDDLLSEVEKGC
jgi:thiol-disulfide isomerase/thioredoxin